MNKVEYNQAYEPGTISDPSYVAQFIAQGVCTQQIAGIGLVCQGGGAEDEIILIPEGGGLPLELASDVKGVFHIDESSRLVYRTYADDRLHWATLDGKEVQTGYILSEQMRIYSYFDAGETHLIRECCGEKKDLYSWAGCGYFEIYSDMIVITTEMDEPIPCYTCMTIDGEMVANAAKNRTENDVLRALFFGLCKDRFQCNYDIPPEPWRAYLKGKTLTLDGIIAMIEVFRENGVADETKIRPFSELLLLLSRSGYARDEDIALLLRAIICAFVKYGRSAKRTFSPALVKKLQERYERMGAVDMRTSFESLEFVSWLAQVGAGKKPDIAAVELPPMHE